MYSNFTKPNMVAPNLRTGRGGIVHLGVWAATPTWSTKRYELVAKCHEATRDVAPGPWTNDRVTCTNCLSWIRKSPKLSKPDLTVPTVLVAERVDLFYEARDYDQGYAADICGVIASQDPADRAIWNEIIQLSLEAQRLPAQCFDADDFEIARLCIADARNKLADLLLQRFLEHSHAG